MKFEKLLFLYFLCIDLQIVFVLENWRNQLSDYDILSNISIRVTRSAFDNKKISFSTKYRNFKLILKPTEDLFTHDFKSVNVDRYGKETPVLIDGSQYYQGFVSGIEKSSVRAYLGNEKLLSINIIVNDEIFQLEPLSRYVLNNSSFIMYRYSDLKSNITRGPLCPTKNISSLHHNESHRRLKRESQSVLSPISTINLDSNKKLCTIKLIADYRFNKKHGRGDEWRTQHYLIELIDKINHLFKSTDFSDNKKNPNTGYGFVIKEMYVHTEPTVGVDNHYNQFKEKDMDGWSVEGLLNSFGEIDHKDACLAHLFTYQSFSEGTLGLAWIASSKNLGNGGICSERELSPHDNRLKSVNTAWSTYRDAVGNHLVSMSAYLVTAHELGHNWGADHDPDNADCSPNAAGGGKYVMYTYSVVGYESNNRIFSPCSIRSIGATIAYRGEYCLLSPDKVLSSFCGNSRVDQNEECDVGRNNSRDLCCTPDCHFREEAECAPQNHECCTQDCKYRQAGFVCAAKDPFNPCLSDSVCNGISRKCPAPKSIDGPNCTEYGFCGGGKCRPYCENFGLKSCICDKIEESCLICCQNPPSLIDKSKVKECQPASAFLTNIADSKLTLNDGRPCAHGVCDKGICKRRVNKLIERIWKIIDEFNTNLFAAFLLDNLVGTVIILTLLLWIPAAIMVSCNDAKHRKQFLHERKIRRPDSMFTTAA